MVGEDCMYGGWGVCGKSVLPSQFCYKPETALRNNKVFNNILMREPDAGLHPRTLGSWPEQKADAQPTEPCRHPY